MIFMHFSRSAARKTDYVFHVLLRPYGRNWHLIVRLSSKILTLELSNIKNLLEINISEVIG